MTLVQNLRADHGVGVSWNICGKIRFWSIPKGKTWENASPHLPVHGIFRRSTRRRRRPWLKRNRTTRVCSRRWRWTPGRVSRSHRGSRIIQVLDGRDFVLLKSMMTWDTPVLGNLDVGRGRNSRPRKIRRFCSCWYPSVFGGYNFEILFLWKRYWRFSAEANLPVVNAGIFLLVWNISGQFQSPKIQFSNLIGWWWI